MSGPRSAGAGPRGARWVGGLGLAISLLLAAFALGPWGDAAAARAEAVATVEREARSFRAREWDALLEADDPIAPRGPVYRWRSGRLERPGRPAGVPLTAADPAGSRVFPTRLAAAEVLEVYDADPGAALEQVTAALDDLGLSARQRGLGRLRALQLAARAGERERVRELWDDLARELDGGETVDGLPALLTAGLAAAPLLTPEERCAVATRLSAAWGGGALALPEEAAQAVAAPRGDLAPPNLVEPARVAALAERVRDLDAGGDCLDPSFAERRERWLALALREQAGALPEPLRSERWELHTTAAGPMAVRGDPSGAREGVFVDPLELGGALAARLAVAAPETEWTVEAARGTLPPGDSLLGGWLRVAPRLERTPPSAVRAGRVANLLRWGLLVAAASLLLASLATARALGRERRLAELKSTFIANVSHELRTPVASILLMAENLERGHVREPAALARYYANLRGEALRLRRLIADVLDFSRLERGAGPRLEREEAALRDWFDDVAREARERASRGGLALEVSDAGLDGRRARLDGESLRRVVLNLVDNAVKYGAAPLALSARVAGDELVLAVADRGPGIPGAEREAVFRPFHRVADGEGAAGTGLGLAIVRALVEAHGGRVSVGSGEDGRGARFEARVPLDSEANEEERG